MGDKTLLLEYGYRDLFQDIDWDFIHMRQHYDTIQAMGVKYEGMPQPGIIEFTTESESRPGLRHHVLIQLKDLEKELANPQNRNIGDAVRAAMSGDLLLHCDCEAFLYYYQWMLLDKDAALFPVAQGNPRTKYDGQDVRPHAPNIKNPGRRGTVCKHIGNVLKVFPFWWNTIAGELQKAGYGVEPSTIEVPSEPQQPPAPQPATQAPAEAPADQEAPKTQGAAYPGWAGVPAGQLGEPQVSQAQEPRQKRKKKAKKKRKQPQQQVYDPFDIRKRIIKNLMYPENKRIISFEKLVEAALLEQSG